MTVNWHNGNREGRNMIRVRFCSDNPSEDVCKLLESRLTGNIDISEWLTEKFPSLDFDCMDFPYDTEDCYDCYFKSDSEETDTAAVYRLLKGSAIGFSVSIVDDKLDLIKEITEG